MVLGEAKKKMRGKKKRKKEKGKGRKKEEKGRRGEFARCGR